jgi:hypothetical protein
MSYSVLNVLYTLFLFTKSDMKTIFFPMVRFPITRVDPTSYFQKGLVRDSFRFSSVYLSSCANDNMGLAVSPAVLCIEPGYGLRGGCS